MTQASQAAGGDGTAPEIELVLLSPPDVPLTPAAAYLARCLTDAIQARGKT